MMKDEYNFEQYLQQDLMDYAIINARRFGYAVRESLCELEKVACKYDLQKEDYYLDTKLFLETIMLRLTAEPKKSQL